MFQKTYQKREISLNETPNQKKCMQTLCRKPYSGKFSTSPMKNLDAKFITRFLKSKK